MNYSIPSSVAVVAWAAFAALVATYTVKSYLASATGATGVDTGDFAPGTPDSQFGGGDFSSGDLSGG